MNALAEQQSDAPVEVEAAAHIAAAGLDVACFLTSSDPLEVAFMQAVAARVAELRAEERLELARLIRNEIAESLNG